MCDITHSHVWYRPFTDVTWLLHTSFICVTWRIHTCDVTIHMCDVTPYVWRDSSICVTWLIHMCDMTHSYVWRDSFICATWPIYMCDMTHYSMMPVPCPCTSLYMTYWYVTRLIHMCDVTQPYVWRFSSICVTWLMYMYDVTPHFYVWHDSSICVTWLIHMCDVTPSYVWRCPTYKWVMSHKWISPAHVGPSMWMCDVTHVYEWREPFICATWLIYMWDMTPYLIMPLFFLPI